ncbi:MAG: type II toxin-antitoxin system HicB family antitoxin [Actinomycetota bacterium]|nr:type II toxin-antitoxin system HicB family antitoxin [Actinomycetota bacterium]
MQRLGELHALAERHRDVRDHLGVLCEVIVRDKVAEMVARVRGCDLEQAECVIRVEQPLEGRGADRRRVHLMTAQMLADEFGTSSRCSIPPRHSAQYAVGMELHVVYEPDEEGWVRASIEELPGVITCAPTLEEARVLVRDALNEWLEALTSDERATLSDDATRETLTLSVA